MVPSSLSLSLSLSLDVVDDDDDDDDDDDAVDVQAVGSSPCCRFVISTIGSVDSSSLLSMTVIWLLLVIVWRWLLLMIRWTMEFPVRSSNSKSSAAYRFLLVTGSGVTCVGVGAISLV